MAQRIGAKGKPVGRPPLKQHATKPAKAPIDEFFHAVRSPVKGYGQTTHGPVPPHPATPRPRAPRRVPTVALPPLPKGERPFNAPPLPKPLKDNESVGHALFNLSSNIIGPNLTHFLTTGQVTPMTALEAGLLFLPAKGLGRGLRGIDEGLGTAARVGRAPAQRAVRVGEQVVTGPASRGIAGSAIQRGVDKATQRAIDKAGGGLSGLANAPRYARKNVSNLVKTGEFYTNIVERAPQEALAHTKLSAVKQLALRMVAHETPADVWIANNNRIIAAGASKATVKNLRKENALLREASRYVRVVDAKDAKGVFATRLAAGAKTVVLDGRAPRDLHHAWTELMHTSRQMGEQGRLLGRLSPEEEAARLSAPGRFHRGARWDAAEGRLVGAEDFQGGRVYMPSSRQEKLIGTGQYKPSAGDALAHSPRGGTEFRHPYRGILPLLGEESHNITQLTGRAALGRQRLYQGVQKLQHLQNIAVKPEDLTAHDLSISEKQFFKRWQPVKMVAQLSDRTKSDLNKALGKIDQGAHLTRSEENNVQKVLGDAYEEVIQHATSFADLSGKEIRYVPKALAGDLHQYDPITRFDRMWGAISDPLKKVIVYTKVGHVGPRLASNLFFNLGQQGVLLVPTAARTFILSKTDPVAMRWVDALMGEGSYGAISEGLHDITTRALVTPVRKIADLMPRRFAFVYEAQKAYGRPFRNTKEASDFLNGLRAAPVDSQAHRMLVEITQRARVAAGEYQRMSNFEKRKVSKFLFLYAWHRTAAVSAAKFALEHPVQAGAVGAGTYYLTRDVNKNAPPWEKFAVPLGGGKISNLATSLPWSTPVEDAMKLNALRTVLSGGKAPPLGESPIGELNPALILPYMILAGRDPETGNPLKKNFAQDFLEQTPIGAAVSGKRPLDQRLGKYLVGNPYPTLSSTALSSGGTGSPVLSTRPGSITPAQHAKILRLVKQARRNAQRAAAQARKRQAKTRR